MPYVGYNSSYSVNFGQDGTFAGQETSGGNSDANDIGDFMFAVPTNCLALCTSNMVDPTVGPNSGTQATDHFNQVLYTGDGSGQSITGVGFQPDWVWIKSRSHASDHVLTDSSRGVTKSLFSNNYNVESALSGGVTAFGTDGFTLGSEGTVNTATRTYVAWNWKGNGGTTTSDGNGSITSTVQVNQKAGFSIVTYTGTGASSATIGHGLGAVPKQIWVKNRDATYNWKVYHAGNTTAPETDYLVLDTADATADSNTHWNDTAPTSTVFTIGSSNGLIKDTNKYIAYCFADVDGYSKFGGYIGNATAAGPFVYTGFRPAFLLLKNTNTSNYWRMWVDDGDGNIQKNGVYPNDAAIEDTPTNWYVDWYANGFKVRGSQNEANGDGNIIVYMAFADQPFKYANAG